MRYLYALLILFATLFCRADTVTFTMTNSVGNPDTNGIKLTPLSSYQSANGTYQTRGLPFWIYPNTNGIVVTNLGSGFWMASNAVMVSTLTPFNHGTWQGYIFNVIGSGGSYQFTTYPLGGYNVYAPINGVQAVVLTNGFVGGVTNNILYLNGSGFNPSINYGSVTGALAYVPMNSSNPIISTVILTNGPSFTNGSTLFLNTNYDQLGAAQAATNGLGSASRFNTNAFDLAGSAQAVTNGMGTSTGLAAFTSTNQYDAAGKAQAATNGLGSSAFLGTNFFDWTGTAKAATNGLASPLAAFSNTNQFDANGAAQAATNALSSGARISTNALDLAGTAQAATNGIGRSTGLAAFANTNQFDQAGAAQASTNSLGNAAYASTNQFQAAGSVQAATNAIGVPSGLSAFAPTNQFDASGAAQKATNALGNSAYTSTNQFDANGAALNATNGLAVSKGVSAFVSTNQFDYNGAAQAATNSLGNAARVNTNALDLAGTALAATNGLWTDIINYYPNHTLITTNNGTNYIFNGVSLYGTTLISSGGILDFNDGNIEDQQGSLGLPGQYLQPIGGGNGLIWTAIPTNGLASTNYVQIYADTNGAANNAYQRATNAALIAIQAATNGIGLNFVASTNGNSLQQTINNGVLQNNLMFGTWTDLQASATIIGLRGAGYPYVSGLYDGFSPNWTNFFNTNFTVVYSVGNYYAQSNGVSLYASPSGNGTWTVVNPYGIAPAPVGVNPGQWLHVSAVKMVGFVDATNLTAQWLSSIATAGLNTTQSNSVLSLILAATGPTNGVTATTVTNIVLSFNYANQTQLVAASNELVTLINSVSGVTLTTVTNISTSVATSIADNVQLGGILIGTPGNAVLNSLGTNAVNGLVQSNAVGGVVSGLIPAESFSQSGSNTIISIVNSQITGGSFIGSLNGNGTNTTLSSAINIGTASLSVQNSSYFDNSNLLINANASQPSGTTNGNLVTAYNSGSRFHSSGTTPFSYGIQFIAAKTLQVISLGFSNSSSLNYGLSGGMTIASNGGPVVATTTFNIANNIGWQYYPVTAGYIYAGGVYDLYRTNNSLQTYFVEDAITSENTNIVNGGITFFSNGSTFGGGSGDAVDLIFTNAPNFSNVNTINSVYGLQINTTNNGVGINAVPALSGLSVGGGDIVSGGNLQGGTLIVTNIILNGSQISLTTNQTSFITSLSISAITTNSLPVAYWYLTNLDGIYGRATNANFLNQPAWTNASTYGTIFVNNTIGNTASWILSTNETSGLSFWGKNGIVDWSGAVGSYALSSQGISDGITLYNLPVTIAATTTNASPYLFAGPGGNTDGGLLTNVTATLWNGLVTGSGSMVQSLAPNITNAALYGTANLNGASVLTNNAGGLTLSGAFTGSGSGLTNVNAAKLGAVLPNGYIQNYIQNPLFLWNGQQALSANPLATNGQFIPPVDYSGNNWVILTNAIGSTHQPRFSVGNLIGRPGFSFSSSSIEVSNICFSMTNGFLIAFTYQDFSGTPVSGGWIGGLGGWGVSDGNREVMLEDVDNNGSVSGGEAAGLTGGTAFWENNISDFPGGLFQLPGLTHVATFSWDGGNNVWSTMDGKPTWDERIQFNGNFSTLMNGATNLYIGSDVSSEYGGQYFNGVISDVRIYTNAPTPQVQKNLLIFLCQQAGLPVNCFNFGGDSIMVSLHTWTSMSAIQQQLAPQFPNYLFNTEATSGRTSAEELTNQQQWVSQKLPGNNFYLTDASINDFFPNGATGLTAALAQSNQVVITATTYTNMILNAESNDMPIAFQTLTSVYWETNSQKAFNYDWRSNINVEIRSLTNLWAQVYIVDVAAGTSLGTNGAYANTTLFNTDQTHPTSIGYTNMAAVYLPVMQAMASPIQTNGASIIGVNASTITGTIPITSIKGIGGITNAYIYGAVTGTNTFSYSVPAGTTNSYEVYGKLTVTALSLDVAQPKLVWTDETGTVQTLSLGTSISGTGYNNLPFTTILAKGGTSIFLTNALTTATGSITYNVDAHLTGISSTQ